MHRTKKYVLVMCLTANKGGIRSQALSLCGVLRELGYSPLLVIPKHAHAARKRAADAHVRYLEYAPPKALRKANSPKAICSSAHFFNFLVATYKKYPFCTVHANYPWELKQLYKLKSLLPIKVIYTIHDESPAWQEGIPNCDAVISVSERVAKTLSSRYPSQQPFTTFLPPAFDEKPFVLFRATESRNEFFRNCFNIDVRAKVVCTLVANFYPCKNQAVAIEAAHILLKEHALPLQLILAGCGQTQNSCKNLVQALNIGDSVCIPGYVNDIPSLVAHSDIILNTSTSEAFPISLLEAAALKKPIITSRNTGASTLVQENTTGLQFSWDQPAELASCILRYLEDAYLREQLATACHQRMLNNFTYAHHKKILHEIYQRLFASPTLPAGYNAMAPAAGRAVH